MTIPEIHNYLLESGKTIATAESCTGGNIAHSLTLNAGSSAYYMGGVVSYANEVKQDALGVSKELIGQFGAVSHQVAHEMALGARKKLHADFAVSTTGIAGPSGGSKEKPVGTVWMGVSGPKETKTFLFNFSGNRSDFIQKATIQALNLLVEEMKNDF